MPSSNRFAAFLFAAFSALTPAGADDTPLRRPGENDALERKAPDQTIKYGDHRHQYIDVRLPDATRFGPPPYPGVVILHGGCWVRPYASAGNIGALADALRDTGYVTLNVEYRTLDEAGGGWPGTFDDIATVMDTLSDLDVPLDTSRIATLGHSAGGHLALWAVARTALPERSPLYREDTFAPKGAVVLGGPGDLLNARASWSQGCGIDSVTALLGGEEMRDFNAASASPAELLPFDGAQIFITGTKDRIVPVSVGEAYKERAEAKGLRVQHHILDGASHHDYLNPGNPHTWDVIRRALKEIFTE